MIPGPCKQGGLAAPREIADERKPPRKHDEKPALAGSDAEIRQNRKNVEPDQERRCYAEVVPAFHVGCGGKDPGSECLQWTELILCRVFKVRCSPIYCLRHQYLHMAKPGKCNDAGATSGGAHMNRVADETARALRGIAHEYIARRREPHRSDIN